MQIDIDAIDLKVLISLLKHAGDAFEGKRGYSFVEYGGLTESEDQALRQRMTDWLHTKDAPPYDPGHEWPLLFLRFECLFEKALRESTTTRT